MEIGQNIEEVWLKDKQTSKQTNKQTNKYSFPKPHGKKYKQQNQKKKPKLPNSPKVNQLVNP